MSEKFEHWTSITVRWGDLDAAGHVNNARFFTFLESARLDYLARLGYPFDLKTIEEGPILARAGCTFRSQMNFPQELVVGTRCLRLGRTSLTLHQEIQNPGHMTLFAEADSVLVWFDYREHTPALLPERLRRVITRLDQPADSHQTRETE